MKPTRQAQLMVHASEETVVPFCNLSLCTYRQLLDSYNIDYSSVNKNREKLADGKHVTERVLKSDIKLKRADVTVCLCISYLIFVVSCCLYWLVL